MFVLCAEEWNDAMDKQDQVILGLESSSRTTSDYIQALREGMLKLTHNTGLPAFIFVNSWYTHGAQFSVLYTADAQKLQCVALWPSRSDRLECAKA